jgi:cytochrome c oxidase cbb3-type subunit 3
VVVSGACEQKPRARERTAQPVVEDSALDPRLVKALPSGVNEMMARSGQRLYTTECAACHGPGGAGTQLGPALNTGEWTRISGSPEEIARVIEEGLPPEEPYNIPMPGRAGAFDAEQLKSLAGYVYALHAAKQ